MKNKQLSFWRSLIAFIRLSRAGFRISYSDKDARVGLEIYRFWWNEQMIREMPDIDCVFGRYNTMIDGRTERLS